MSAELNHVTRYEKPATFIRSLYPHKQWRLIFWWDDNHLKKDYWKGFVKTLIFTGRKRKRRGRRRKRLEISQGLKAFRRTTITVFRVYFLFTFSFFRSLNNWKKNRFAYKGNFFTVYASKKKFWTGKSSVLSSLNDF